MGWKCLREIPHIDGETGQIPFHTHQEEIAFVILMLIGVKSIAVGAINKIVDGGVEPFLVRATDEQDGGVFQSTLRNAASRGNAIDGLAESCRPTFFRESVFHSR